MDTEFLVQIRQSNKCGSVSNDEIFNLHLGSGAGPWVSIPSKTEIIQIILYSLKLAAHGNQSMNQVRKKCLLSGVSGEHKDLLKIPLKLVSAIFFFFFFFNFYIFTKWSLFKNYEQCFLFHQKNSLRFQDIQTFVSFSLPFQNFQNQKDKNWNRTEVE